MEQTNKRYIEIISCTKCGYNGHISGDDGNGVIFICSNPEHAGLEIPKKFIGKTAYPIIVTEERNTVHMCHIPSWCTLPRELALQK
jgi:hypothetical protein